ncbi:Protein of unknown function [Nitrosomonas eutropha]|uniref:DUF3417 domain-containing protein n=1 Tax=Nitrosomonas eutropha TaxID=916 RepID=A0A1I7IY28_9PROT|nr:Protein of unknown function [Nitrosomonas eutropha]
MTQRTAFTLTVNPKIPERLARLEELANNLWYSWDRATRALFSRLDPQLWESVGHSPKAFLRRVDESLLLQAAEDLSFLSHYNSVLSAYDSYHLEPSRYQAVKGLDIRDQVAYFCLSSVFMKVCRFIPVALAFWRETTAKLPVIYASLLWQLGCFTGRDISSRLSMAMVISSLFTATRISRIYQ